MEALSIIDYIDGLTAFVLDKAVLKRIAFDRGVLGIDPTDLTEKQKELLHADVLFVIWSGPNNTPSLSHQHGQFSTTRGSQTYGDKEDIYDTMVKIYRKYGDAKLDLIPESSLSWME